MKKKYESHYAIYKSICFFIGYCRWCCCPFSTIGSIFFYPHDVVHNIFLNHLHCSIIDIFFHHYQ